MIQDVTNERQREAVVFRFVVMVFPRFVIFARFGAVRALGFDRVAAIE